MIAAAELTAAASLAAAVAIAASWVARTWRKAAAPTAPLMDLGTAGGTTPTTDAAEDDEEGNVLLVADMVMLDMMEWVRWDIADYCAVELWNQWTQSSGIANPPQEKWAISRSVGMILTPINALRRSGHLSRTKSLNTMSIFPSLEYKTSYKLRESQWKFFEMPIINYLIPDYL
jgi:hypothetical protein